METTDLKYYLFEKGSQDFLELGYASVSVINESHKLEPVLRQLDGLSRTIGAQQDWRFDENPPQSIQDVKHTPTSELLRVARSEDKEWFDKYCPSAELVKNSSTGKLAWRVRNVVKHKQSESRYEYPTEASGNLSGQLTVRIQGKLETLKDIAIDSSRFQLLKSVFCRTARESTLLFKPKATGQSVNVMSKGKSKRSEGKD